MGKRSYLGKVALMALPLLLFAFTVLGADEKMAPAPATIPAPEPAKAPLVPPTPAASPKFHLQKVKKLEGGEVTFGDLLNKKKYTVVVFFQSACIACTTELKELQGKYPNDQVDVIGVGLDVRQENLKKHVEALGYPKVVLWDPDFRFAPYMEVSFSPAVVLLGKGGQRVGFFAGYQADTLAKIQELIK